MKPRLRIAIADDEPEMREFLQRILPRMGHQVVAAAENGMQLVEACRQAQPDLIVTDIVMPIMDGISAVTQVCHERPVPIIVVSAYYDETFLKRLEVVPVMAYLVKPIKQMDLGVAIAIAVRSFEQLNRIRQEAEDLRQALRDRKTIERAKGILMKWCQCDEPTAFRRLQRLASERNRKLIEVAEAILLAEDARCGCAASPTPSSAPEKVELAMVFLSSLANHDHELSKGSGPTHSRLPRLNGDGT